MGIKFKGRMKKIMVEALATAFLLVPMVQPYAGAADEIPKGEVLVSSELPGADGRNGDEIMPCGDFVDEDENICQSNS